MPFCEMLICSVGGVFFKIKRTKYYLLYRTQFFFKSFDTLYYVLIFDKKYKKCFGLNCINIYQRKQKALKFVFCSYQITQTPPFRFCINTNLYFVYNFVSRFSFF